MIANAVSTRLEILRSFVADKPDDPFPRYGLATELKNLGRLEEASREFADLLARFPDYTAGYLHAGNVLRALKRRDQALAVYRAGIAACARKGDQHAQGELETALEDAESE
jgi:tetratricopeptide (TPR) repeat protein